MEEFQTKFWNSFWKVCQLEFQNVSFAYFLILSLIGAILVHITCLIYVRVKKRSIHLSTELLIILLLSYLILIANVTILNREAGSQLRVFDTKWLWINDSMDQNMTNLLNILLFIPLGALLAGIQVYSSYRMRILMTVSYCFLTSIVIECVQYISRRGYCEIDDIEANVLGGLIGSLLVNLCSWIGSIIHKKLEVKT